MVVVVCVASVLAGCGSFDVRGAASAAAALREAEEAVLAIAHASEDARRGRAVRWAMERGAHDARVDGMGERVGEALRSHASMLAELAEGYAMLANEGDGAAWPAQLATVGDALLVARARWREGRRADAALGAASVAQVGFVAGAKVHARRALDGLAADALRLGDAVTPELASAEAIIVSEQRATLRAALATDLVDIGWPADPLGVGSDAPARFAAGPGNDAVRRRAQEAAWGAWCHAQSERRLERWRTSLHAARAALRGHEAEGGR